MKGWGGDAASCEEKQPKARAPGPRPHPKLPRLRGSRSSVPGSLRGCFAPQVKTEGKKPLPAHL